MSLCLCMHCTGKIYIYLCSLKPVEVAFWHGMCDVKQVHFLYSALYRSLSHYIFDCVDCKTRTHSKCVCLSVWIVDPFETIRSHQNLVFSLTLVYVHDAAQICDDEEFNSNSQHHLMCTYALHHHLYTLTHRKCSCILLHLHTLT